MIYLQNQPTSLHHEQHLPPHLQSHPQLHNHHMQPPSHIQDQLQPPIHQQHLNVAQQKIDHQQLEQHQPLPELNKEKMNESQKIIHVCSDVCSSSNSSCNENSQNSSVDEEVTSDNSSNKNKTRKTARFQKKKKGGKIKGTLETSVEMRNRMIGMSEAGLSTLSIALAINRSVCNILVFYLINLTNERVSFIKIV